MFTSFCLTLEIAFKHLHHIFFLGIKVVVATEDIIDELPKPPIWALTFPNVSQPITEGSDSLGVTHNVTSLIGIEMVRGEGLEPSVL